MRLSNFLSTSSKMELHLSMKLDFLNRRKGKAPCWWHGIFEDTFALSVLWSTPAKDHSRYLSFSECWNSREPNEAVAMAAVCSLLFWARRKPWSHILLFFFLARSNWDGSLCKLLCRNGEDCELLGKQPKGVAKTLPSNELPACAVPSSRGRHLIHQGSHLTRERRKEKSQKNELQWMI